MSDNDLNSELSENTNDKYPEQRGENHRKWRKHTERERGEYASLIRARNEDLSIHLYNAHILRQRAKEYKEDPLNAKVNFEFPNIPENQRTFKPPNVWTAWPLSPNDVPRLNQNYNLHDGLDIYTIKRTQPEWPSHELEEIIQSITLKLARQKFDSREYEPEKRPVSRKSNTEDVIDYGSVNENEKNKFPKISESKISQSLKKSQENFLKPVFISDEERCRLILRPSIRHILTKIDHVLTGLHQTRKLCYICPRSKKDTDKEATSFSPAKISEKTIRERPTYQKIYEGSKENPEQNKSPRQKRNQGGRPPKIYERLDGETEQEYLVRIARKRKKAIPLSLQAKKIEKPNQPKPKLPTTFKHTFRDRFFDRKRKLELRDWSELVSTAALIGIPPDVVVRTTQRCVDVFGESILMKAMNEAHHKDKSADSLQYYRSSQDLDKSDSNMAALISCPLSHAQNLVNGSSQISLPECKLLSKQIYLCPITSCPRSLQGFQDQDSVVRHLNIGHGIERELAKDNILSSPEDLDGAIHVDGYLRSVGLHLVSLKDEKLRKNFEISIPQQKMMDENYSNDSNLDPVSSSNAKIA